MHFDQYYNLKNHEGFERTSFDIPSIALSSLGMLGLLYGLSTVTSILSHIAESNTQCTNTDTQFSALTPH